MRRLEGTWTSEDAPPHVGSIEIDRIEWIFWQTSEFAGMDFPANLSGKPPDLILGKLPRIFHHIRAVKQRIDSEAVCTEGSEDSEGWEGRVGH